MKFINQKSLFKIIGASALATCMLATSLFAFIPNSTQAETLNSTQNPSNPQTTEQSGLITPRADDPILFTTESGLEIKYGNALTGNLAGFPCFTTNDGTTNYDWVIIGIAPNIVSIFEQNDTGVFLAQWLTQSTSNSQHFISTTLASSDVVSTHVVSEGLYRDKIQDASAINNFSITPKNNSEIPNGCALVMSNLSLASLSNHSSGEIAPNWKTSNIRIAFNEFYQNGDFGLKLIKSLIKKTTLTTIIMTGKSSLSSVTTDDYIFLLAESTSSSYCVFTYLFGHQNLYEQFVWARGAENGQYVSSSGGYFSNAFYQDSSLPHMESQGVTKVLPCRGAFVMNFLGVQ